MQLNDQIRIRWAAARYALWLDLHHVPGRVRRDMTRTLRANLSDAARSVGVAKALANVGSLRSLARAEAIDAGLRSPWLAAFTVGFVTLGLSLLTFFLLSLYYVEGVLDTGVTQPVSGGLFPFVGSQVTVVNNGDAGFSFDMAPGYLPFILAAVVFIVVARPWRTFVRSDVSAQT